MQVERYEDFQHHRIIVLLRDGDRVARINFDRLDVEVGSVAGISEAISRKVNSVAAINNWSDDKRREATRAVCKSFAPSVIRFAGKSVAYSQEDTELSRALAELGLKTMYDHMDLFQKVG